MIKIAIFIIKMFVPNKYKEKLDFYVRKFDEIKDK